jgi:hypothetical protein
VGTLVLGCPPCFCPLPRLISFQIVNALFVNFDDVQQPRRSCGNVGDKVLQPLVPFGQTFHLLSELSHLLSELLHSLLIALMKGR